ncbi:MAG: hypothetical protein H0T96_06440 [Thermoleophilaceae bacterium]|nr:hypothetical protein [Thermoleophilaceae bacterium]
MSESPAPPRTGRLEVEPFKLGSEEDAMAQKKSKQTQQTQPYGKDDEGKQAR